MRAGPVRLVPSRCQQGLSRRIPSVPFIIVRIIILSSSAAADGCSLNRTVRAMKTLLILRHAKSSWKDSDASDHERPLNKRGRHTAPRVGELLQQEDLLPDRILCSTALRARDTARLVAESCAFEGPLEASEELYPGAPSDYLDVLVRLEDDVESVMVVGHNPGLELLLGLLVGEVHTLPTAALARVELPIGKWRELTPATRGRLVSLWRPKDE